MRVSALKTAPPFGTTNLRSLKVQAYGEHNDLPQRVSEIVAASVTGRTCLTTYQKFVYGRGFADPMLASMRVNGRGDTAAGLLRAVSEDYCEFGGFAVHVNWNALGRIVSLAHVPFEWLRFEMLDENYCFRRLAMHPDWGLRLTALRRFSANDTRFFPFFNPDMDAILREVEESGGWNGYRGQIFYYSSAGEKVYPVPSYAAALTDMSNEEGLANLKHRNVRHGFLPAGYFIDRNNTANSTEQEEDTKRELTEFQGDENAGKILYINLGAGEEAPEFKAFDTRNTDSEFKNAESITPDNIGYAFCQPPILRGKDVGSNFGSDLIRNAYNFYNAQTENERGVLEEAFGRLFAFWGNGEVGKFDTAIMPKVYNVEQTLAERLGSNTEKMLEVVSNAGLSLEVKKGVLGVVYGLTEDEIAVLLDEGGASDVD